MMNNDTTVNEDSAVFPLGEMRGKLIKTIGSYDDYIRHLNLYFIHMEVVSVKITRFK